MPDIQPTPAPKVSFLLSCFNGARWLDVSIPSVLGQTWTDFEFIIVDDGSTDASLACIQRYAAQDPRIVVIEKANSGLADSLNVGMQRARGEWIARIDADDLHERHKLERQMAVIAERPRTVYVGSDFVQIDAAGRAGALQRYPTSHRGLLRHLRAPARFPPHSSALFRREAALAGGGYRQRLRRAEDWDLWLRLSDIGELASVGEPLVRIRKHADQISHDEAGRRQAFDCRMAIVADYLRSAEQPDPIASDDAQFVAFETWLMEALAQARFFSHLETDATLRLQLADARHAHAPLSAAYAALASPGATARLIMRRLLGEPLLQRLARRWAAMQQRRDA